MHQLDLPVDDLTAVLRVGVRGAVQELTWRPTVLADVVRTDMRLEAGNLYSGGSPGLGVELDDDAARAYPFQLPGLRVLRREDNSVSDW